MITQNAQNGAQLFWVNDDAGKHTALKITVGEQAYQFDIHLHGKKDQPDIGFIRSLKHGSSKYTVSANIKAFADLPAADKASFPKIAHWIDQQIIRLSGGKAFIKRLSSDVYKQILNDPTHSLNLNRKPASYGKFTAEYIDTTHCWKVRTITFGTKRQRQIFTFPLVRFRGDARAIAQNANERLSKSRERFIKWHEKHFGDRKPPQLTIGGQRHILNNSLYDDVIRSKIDHKQLRTLQSAASHLRELRGGEYIGVMSEKTPSGNNKYRAQVNRNDTHWESDLYDTAEQAARVHDTAFRKLFTLNNHLRRRQLNHLNFFDAPLLAVEPLPEAARATFLSTSRQHKYFTVHHPQGHIEFRRAERAFYTFINRPEGGGKVNIGVFKHENEAALAFDKAITQAYPSIAHRLRINAYTNKTIQQWASEPFSHEKRARIKRWSLEDGTKPVFIEQTLVGHRAIVIISEDETPIYGKIHKIDEHNPADITQQIAMRDYDRILASTAKARDFKINYQSADPAQRHTYFAYDDRWWLRNSAAHGKMPKTSGYMGVRRIDNDLITTWDVHFNYRPTGAKSCSETVIIGCRTEKVAYQRYDRLLRSSYDKGEISLDYFLQRINQPNQRDIVLAKFLGRAHIGFGDYKTDLATVSDNIYKAQMDNGEVTGTLSYTTSTGDKQFIGIYARIATADHAEQQAAYREAKQLANKHSARLSSDALDLDMLDKLLQSANEQRPADYPTSHATLNRRLMQSLGLCGIDNPGRGNCLFYAYAQQLTRLGITKTDATAYTHSDLRQIAVNEMFNHIDVYRPFITGHADDYLWYMAANGVWAEHLPIQALARHFNLNTIITHANGNPETDQTRHTIFRQTAAIDATKTIVLGYIDNVHYVSAEPIAADDAQVAHRLDAATYFARINALIAPISIDEHAHPAEPAYLQPQAPLHDDMDEDTTKKKRARRGPSPSSTLPALQPLREPSELTCATTRVDAAANNDTDEDTAIIKRARPRLSASSMFPTLRPLPYQVRFAQRIDSKNPDAVILRLSSLLKHFINRQTIEAPLTQQQAALIFNNLAATITTQREALGLSKRAAVLIDSQCRQFAVDRLGYNASNRSDILRHITTALTYLAHPSINLQKEAQGAPANVDDLFIKIGDIVTNTTGRYGDNRGFNPGCFANVCYHALQASLSSHSHAATASNCQREFCASFGDDIIHTHGTLQAPWSSQLSLKP